MDECVTRTMAPRMADSGRGHHVLDSDSVLEAATGSRMPPRPRRARPSSSDSPGRRLPRLLPAMLGQPDRERVECSSRSLTGLHRVGETSRLVRVNSGSAHDASRRKTVTRETLESDRLSVGARRGVRGGQHLHARGPGPAPAPRRGPVRGPRHAALGQRLPAPVRAPQAGPWTPRRPQPTRPAAAGGRVRPWAAAPRPGRGRVAGRAPARARARAPAVSQVLRARVPAERLRAARQRTAVSGPIQARLRLASESPDAAQLRLASELQWRWPRRAGRRSHGAVGPEITPACRAAADRPGGRAARFE